MIVVAPESFGDCFERARWLPELTRRGIDWSLVIRPELLSVFRRAFPENQVISELPADAFPWIDMLDGISFAGPRPPAIRFCPLSEQVEKYSAIPHPSIGLCVQSASRLGDSWRGLKEIGARKIISAFPEVTWVSLHKDYLREYEKPLPCLRPLVDDANSCTWEDTLGLIENLDAVVTVDSAIAHLALSMGKSTVVLFGTAPTTSVKYTDFKSMYPAAPLQTFMATYGGSQAQHSWEKFIERASKPHFLNLITQGTL